MEEQLKQKLRDAGIKFVRIIWCDNANVIRAKAAHVDYLDDYIDNGVGITMAQLLQSRRRWEIKGEYSR